LTPAFDILEGMDIGSDFEAEYESRLIDALEAEFLSK